MKYLFSVFMLFLIIALGFVFADSNGIWHRAEDVRPGTFGADEDIEGNFRFINPVEFNEDVLADDISLNVIRSSRSDGNVIIQLG